MTETAKISVKRDEKARRGTAELLLSKARKSTEITIDIGGEPLTLKFEAISAHEMDALITRCPPTKEQRARGMSYNPNLLNPELVALCSVEPKLEKSQTRDMWNSENWSAGELNQLSDACLNLCSEGFGSSFTNSD